VHMDKPERKFLLVRECCRDTAPEAFKSKKRKTELRKGSVPMRTEPGGAMLEQIDERLKDGKT
jgi:hypothetical protein